MPDNKTPPNRNGLLEAIFILGKQLAEEDGKDWQQLSGEERNNYYTKASHLPRQ